jgi:1-acyl-sn-glycerol-3-phosphate acyltransferase
MKNLTPNPAFTETPTWLRIWTSCHLMMKIICGVFTLIFIFPFLNRRQKDRKIQQWSQDILNIFNIELIIEKAVLLENTPYLIASNHISWLDIHVLHAFKPIRFVAKSEVEKWPLFGWMAQQVGTVFIRRDSARHAKQVVGQMAEVLKTESICIFPEGTSTAGASILPFKPNLFESAILAQVPVYPMAIQYLSKMTGERSESPAFIGDMGLLESISNIIKNRTLVAKITFLEPYQAGFHNALDRKLLANSCHDAIAKAL